jgi:rhamnose utilization protein RhaD (predicted bifunctional aldolase and dehydrogenase)/NAD(P)-dependent dehydrogenase (short-subunit alcohol dehydrogenase family)
MESSYRAAQAEKIVEKLSSIPEVLALRTYTARLLGADPSLVLHGGGNTSAKGESTTLLGETVSVLYVKGSGWDLATIEPAGHPAVRLEPLRALRALPSLTDEAMVNALRLALLDAQAPTPSVEALLHAYLPARFIDHTHADAILAVSDQPDGEQLCRSIFGPGLLWIPYVMPGFALAKRCADAFEAAVARGQTPTVMVLERHGLFTWGETAQESYERTIDAVTLAERFLADRRAPTAAAPAPVDGLDIALLPRIRGLLAKLWGMPHERGPFVALRCSDAILAFLERDDAATLTQVGTATPDHVLRTKPHALFVANPDYSDLPALTARLEQECLAYAERYDAYFDRMCAQKAVVRKKLDPWPRVILLPRLGLVTVGRTPLEPTMAADIYEHTVSIMACATDVGRYTPVSLEDLFDVEYWSLEQAKIKRLVEPALFGKVMVVTGAASGIGLATARRMADLGADVALMDRDQHAVLAESAALSKGRVGRVLPFVADVTSWEETRRAMQGVVRAFGGLDGVVSNAGSASEGRLETERGQVALQRSLDLNLMSHTHVARAAVEVMSAQGRGGALLFNASKSAFNQGPGFGPYAVAKAALVALMRQYAVDLACIHVRANAVNADRIRTQLFAGGVVESRAAARGLSVDQYFQSNLLAREVTADDVADAFVYLATARSTTGCVITVDGGNAAAFPR